MTPAKRYIQAAYHYYHLDESLMSDQEFDLLAVHLSKSYETEVEDEGFSHLITRGDLEAGTLLLAEDKYPEWAKEGAA